MEEIVEDLVRVGRAYFGDNDFQMLILVREALEARGVKASFYIFEGDYLVIQKGIVIN